MATRGTVKLYCPEVVEKIWETIARGRGSQIFSITEGQWFDCSPSSLEITVFYYPIVLNRRNTVNNMPILVVDVVRFDVT